MCSCSLSTTALCCYRRSAGWNGSEITNFLSFPAVLSFPVCCYHPQNFQSMRDVGVGMVRAHSVNWNHVGMGGQVLDKQIAMMQRGDLQEV